jgi:hypothetical protein
MTSKTVDRTEHLVDPRATRLDFTTDELTITLADGRRLTVPLDWYADLQKLPDAQRSQYRLDQDGRVFYWDDPYDVWFSVAGLFGLPDF